MSISAGELDRRGTLQQPVDTADGQGGYVTTWPDVAAVWAKYFTPSVRNIQAIGTVVSDYSQVWKIRYRSDVCRGWRWVCGGRTYEIDDAYPEGRRDLTVIVCHELRTG